MSHQEVTKLRKSGHLNEAIEMAQKDVEYRCDSWSLDALFWCLNDLYKQQNGEEKRQTVNWMKTIADKFDRKDELMEKCLEKAEFSFDPMAEKIEKLISDSKNGQTYWSYKEFTKIYDEGKLPQSQHERYGWVILRELREDEQLRFEDRKHLLLRYLNLQNERPSRLHSAMLSQAVKFSNKNLGRFDFSAFVQMWNVNNFRESDWKSEGGSSLVERVIGLWVKQLIKDEGKEVSEDLVDLIDKAVKKSPTDLRIMRNKAQISAKMGKIDEAKEMYIKALKKRPGRYYLWEELADIVDDREQKMIFLCKAKMCEPDEEFLGNVHLKLARLMIEMNLFERAKCEIEQAEKLYFEKVWKLPDDFDQIKKQIPGGTKIDDTEWLFEKYCEKAEFFLFSDFESVVMVKIKEHIENINGKEKAMWTIVDERARHIKIEPKRYGITRKTNDGTCLEVKMERNDPIFVKIINKDVDLAWVKTIREEVMRNSFEDKRK